MRNTGRHLFGRGDQQQVDARLADRAEDIVQDGAAVNIEPHKWIVENEQL